MRTKILRWLNSQKEEKYKNFSAKLLPKEVKLLGVRIPELRKYVKQIIKNNITDSVFNQNLKNMEYQEELMIYALALANCKISTDIKIKKIKEFIPYINSWAICDIFCADLKEIKKNPQYYYDIFLEYTKSNSEYQIRFFYVLALNYFLTDELLDSLLYNIKQQNYIGYYDKMAVAWLLSVAYVKYPQEIEEFIFNQKLDDFIFKKTISKINDSYRVGAEAKARLRALALIQLNK
jgi:3-methyladenine DNA glycosylase AlkD